MRNLNQNIGRRTFLNRAAMATVACGMGTTMAEWDSIAGGAGGTLQRVTPESVGIDSGAVLAFIDAVEKQPGGVHSVMLLRHGKVVAEGWWAPYTAHDPHMLYSLSKSFTSTAVGLAVSEGLFTVEDLVTSFFPDQLPAHIDPNLAKMRIRHLLTMNTGHDKDATGAIIESKDGDWVKQFLSLPVEHEPGTKFVYNSAATYMLSAIVQKKSGKPVLDYLTPRLFQPLGIQGPTWETCPKGINSGGWGLSVKTEDIARFGQLYLQKGVWQGKQLVPAQWVVDATSKQVSNGDPNNPSDWSQGYGYQFWRSRHGAFRGDGAFGQYCVVLPESDVVLAITSGVGDMQAILNQVWDHLLPGIHSEARVASAASLEQTKEQTNLKYRLTHLALPIIHSAPDLTPPQIAGKRYTFGANSVKLETMSLTTEGDRVHIKLKYDDSERSLVFGSKSWVKGTSQLKGLPSRKVMCQGVWTAHDTFKGMVCFYETPYIQHIECRLTDQGVHLSFQLNVSFGGTGATELIGTAV